MPKRTQHLRAALVIGRVDATQPEHLSELQLFVDSGGIGLGADGTFRFAYPVVGDDAPGDELRQRDNSIGLVTISIPYMLGDSHGRLISGGTLDTIVGMEFGSLTISHLDSDDQGAPDSGSEGGTSAAQIQPFIVDANEFAALVANVQGREEHKGPRLLAAIRELGEFTGESIILRSQAADLIAISERTGIGVGDLQAIVERWEALTTFRIAAPDLSAVTGAGKLILTAPDGAEISAAQLGWYRIRAELPVKRLDGDTIPEPLEVVMEDPRGPVTGPVSFELVPHATLHTASVHGPASVQAVSPDGAVAWSKQIPSDDPAFRKIMIELPALEAPQLQIELPKLHGQPAIAASRQEKLRGQVLASGASQEVGGLTIVLQAKASKKDSVWRPVSAGETAHGGYFTLPYPRGSFEQAQVFVSAAPDAVVEVPIVDSGVADETISKDFIYLLLTTELPPEAVKEACCDECAAKPARLPGQEDLIGSDQFSQDLGGACVNLTTPNRTLREFGYHALVRSDDPDVAEVTLLREGDKWAPKPSGAQPTGPGRLIGARPSLAGSGGSLQRGLQPITSERPSVLSELEVDDWPSLTEYRLSPPILKSVREPVTLANPIRWQDAPGADEHLTFYQPVSVATGHVLYYRSRFKADGYSLGDLVYSLPLAPGQKKQIVSYDVANSLQAAERQETGQRESLAAELRDDRFITDQLGGSLRESVSGRSDSSTEGVSAGIGVGGTLGFVSGSLGVAGGYSSSSASSSQRGSRKAAQHFDEKLRQSLTQNAESYRRVNASVVTTVKEGQEYAVETEVVANHNHCHSLTMMYFEVLRHYAVAQELVDVQECLFVPLQLTEFGPENIAKWKDQLARHLLPVPSNTYVRPMVRFGPAQGKHPLLSAFDAVERIRTNYERVDFPEGRYADEEITSISGEATLRVHIPRPRTRLDRIKSFPIVTETTTKSAPDVESAIKYGVFGAFGLAAGLITKDVSETHVAVGRIFDAFFDLDANYRRVRPAHCIRVKSFKGADSILSALVEAFPMLFHVGDEGTNLDFFENASDRAAWQLYANVMSAANPKAEYKTAEDLLEAFFKDKLVAEWDDIFYTDIAPTIYRYLAEKALSFDGEGGPGLSLDATLVGGYTRGGHTLKIRLHGDSQLTRAELAPSLKVWSKEPAAKALQNHVTFVLEQLDLEYVTDHFRGPIFRGRIGNDLLDETGAIISIPLTTSDKRHPRKDDIYLAQELIDHLNSNLEHYNRVLWAKLDEGRRHMLLDGFGVRTYDDDGSPGSIRSLASVVKDDLVAIVGNSLVFAVADGFHVNQSWAKAKAEPEGDYAAALLAQYKSDIESPPYRLSVPTRGVYGEAVMGKCDSCEEVKPNSSQDWDEFRTDEPTGIGTITVPTPERSDWKAIWAQLAQPIVQMQAAPAAPAPGAGLAGLSDALTQSDAFRDAAGLAGTQANVMQTYLSNQENARAFAEMATKLAIQEHNTKNLKPLLDGIEHARSKDLVTGDGAQAATGGVLSGAAGAPESESGKQETVHDEVVDWMKTVRVGSGQIETVVQDSDGFTRVSVKHTEGETAGASTAAPTGGRLGTCWPVKSDLLLAKAVELAKNEHELWSQRNLTDESPLKGSPSEAAKRIKDYWRSCQVSGFTSTDQAWSAAFISWLFCQAYLELAPPEVVFGAMGPADLDRLPVGKDNERSRTESLESARDCLNSLSVFATDINHYQYFNKTAGLLGTKASILPGTSPLQKGDVVLYSTGSGITLDQKLGRLKTSNSKSTHADIVVGFRSLNHIPEVEMAVLVGGNTLATSDVVGRKYRPLIPGSRVVAPPKGLPDAVQSALPNLKSPETPTLLQKDVDDTEKRGYYSFSDSGYYERVQINPVLAILRLKTDPNPWTA